jgi:hypothetical protein
MKHPTLASSIKKIQDINTRKPFNESCPPWHHAMDSEAFPDALDNKGLFDVITSTASFCYVSEGSFLYRSNYHKYMQYHITILYMSARQRPACKHTQLTEDEL